MCVITVGTAGSLMALLVGGGSSSGSRPGQSARAISDVSESADMLFAVLDSARTAVNALPAVPRGESAGAPGSPLAIADEHAARRLLPTVAAWLVPASDQRLCLAYTVKALTRGPGGASLPPAIVRQCATVSAAAVGRLVATQSLSMYRGFGAALILGVVPDGVAHVSIVSGDGHTTALPVSRNSYAGTIVDPTSVSFSDRVGNGAVVSRTVPVASFDGYAATLAQ